MSIITKKKTTETFLANGTYSVVFVGDDFWEIGTGWKSDNYEKAKALDII